MKMVSRNGQGTETFPDGDKYVGGFKDGGYHGQGTITYPDGSKQEGNWKGGELTGNQTTLTFYD